MITKSEPFIAAKMPCEVLTPRGTPTPPEEASPKSFGKYSIVGELGRGGMGRVYEAVDPELGRRVALKVLLVSPHCNLEEAALEEARFVREARMTARLAKHPHIVGAYEAGEWNGTRYIAMEFIRGLPLQAWRYLCSPSLRQQVAVLGQVALAIHFAHEQGIFHRDLKPQNVVIDGRNRPHITDFGLAKIAGPAESLSLTDSGRALGTPAYMSPEQACGLKTLDRRTDIYSIGVMLYEILTGRLPFVGESAIGTLLKAVSEAPPLPSSVAPTPGMDPKIEAICLKAMAKEPSDRHATARALAEDIARWLRSVPVSIKTRGPRGALSCELAGSHRVHLTRAEGRSRARIRLEPTAAKAGDAGPAWDLRMCWQASQGRDLLGIEFPMPAPGRVRLILTLASASRGFVRTSLNGRTLAPKVDLGAGPELVLEGIVGQGINVLRLEAAEAAPSSKRDGPLLELRGLRLEGSAAVV